MFRSLLRVPIGIICVANACLALFALLLEPLVFETEPRYPFVVLLVGAALMSYLPYYCVTRAEIILPRDPDGQKSKALFYGIAYLFSVAFLIIDVDYLQRWFIRS
jgi:hypothetical protein